jgi:hypothetical protein
MNPSNCLHFFVTFAEEPPVVPTNPCQPSPCGANAQCRDVGGSPSCSCLPEFLGTPPNCRPECVSNSECANHLACVNQKCVDPCPGTCGQNAECRVVSHSPNCICPAGFEGNPFTACTPQSRFRCSLLNSFSNAIFCSYPACYRKTYAMFAFAVWYKCHLSRAERSRSVCLPARTHRKSLRGLQT